MSGNGHHGNYTNYTNYAEDITAYIIDVTLLSTNLLAIVSCGLIIYIIAVHKPLKTTLNACVIQWAILDILHLVTSPALFSWYEQITAFDFNFEWEKIYICLCSSFQIGIMLLLFTLMLQSYVKSLEAHFKMANGIIWGAVILISILGIIFATHHFMVVILILMCLCLVLPVTTLVLCIMFFVRKKHLYDSSSRLKVVLTTTYVFFWFIFVVSFMVTHSLHWVFGHFIILSFACLGSNSLVNLFLLVRLDRNFEMCFKRMLCWKLKKYNVRIETVEEGRDVLNEEA